ncbi:MAG: hypothetical protein HC896_17590, partial [Bacteroidales bacterium]|nr:hypothetical protein [Bacteroidales bacterium]
IVNEQAESLSLPINCPANGNKSARLYGFVLDKLTTAYTYLKVVAPENTVIDVLFSHKTSIDREILYKHPAMLSLKCKQGENVFVSLCTHAIGSLYLHVRENQGNVIVEAIDVINVRQAGIKVSKLIFKDTGLQKIIDTCFQHLDNHLFGYEQNAWPYRIQQSWFLMNEYHKALFYTQGNTTALKNFVLHYANAQTEDGLFLVPWPAESTLNGMGKETLEANSAQLPIEFGIEYVFACFNYLLFTNDLKTISFVYHKLQLYIKYLINCIGDDGLLPHQGLGLASANIYGVRYRHQRHRKCGLNIYVAIMLRHAFAPICQALNDAGWKKMAMQQAKILQKSIVHVFWSSAIEAFVVNQPWLKEEANQPVFDERVAAQSVIYNMCPGANIKPSLTMLNSKPANMLRANLSASNWRCLALGLNGSANKVMNEFKTDWLPQVDKNKLLTYGVKPVDVYYAAIMGLMPLNNGFTSFLIEPNLPESIFVHSYAWTGAGIVVFNAEGKKGFRKIKIKVPEAGNGLLVVANNEVLDLPEAKIKVKANKKAMQLPAGQEIDILLHQT